jgi:cell division protein FtsB
MTTIELVTFAGTVIGGIISVCFTYLQTKKLQNPGNDKDVSKLYRDVAVLKAKLEAINKQQEQVTDQLNRLHDILLKLLDE